MPRFGALALSFILVLVAAPAHAQLLPVCGDVNGDLSVDADDAAVLIAQALGALPPPPPAGGLPSVADVNNDGNAPDVGDVVLLQQLVAQLLPTIDCGFGTLPPEQAVNATLRIFDLGTAFSAACSDVVDTKAALEGILDEGGELDLSAVAPNPPQRLRQRRVAGGSVLFLDRGAGTPEYAFAGRFEGQKFDGDLLFEVSDADAVAGRLRMTGIYTDFLGEPERVHGFVEGSGPEGCYIEAPFTLTFTNESAFDPEMNNARAEEIDRLLNVPPTWCTIDDASDLGGQQPPPEIAGNNVDDDCDGLVDESPAVNEDQAVPGTLNTTFGTPLEIGFCPDGDVTALEDLFGNGQVGNLDDLVQSPTPAGSSLRSLAQSAADNFVVLTNIETEAADLNAAGAPILRSFTGDIFHDPGGPIDFTSRIRLEGVHFPDAVGGNEDRVVARYKAAIAPGCWVAGPVELDDFPASFVPQPVLPQPPGAPAVTIAGIRDSDGDTLPDGADCNDLNATIFPGAAEDTLNTLDEDCDGLVNDFTNVTSLGGAKLTLFDLAERSACVEGESSRLTDNADAGLTFDLIAVRQRPGNVVGPVSSLIRARTTDQADTGLEFVGAFLNELHGINVSIDPDRTAFRETIGTSRVFSGGLYTTITRNDLNTDARLTLEGLFVQEEPDSAFDNAIFGFFSGTLSGETISGGGPCDVTGGFVFELDNANNLVP